MKNAALLFLLPALLLLPWLLLVIAGGVWVWQHQFLPIAASAILSCYGLAWILSRYLKHEKPPPLPSVDPDDRWSPGAKDIWDKIDTLADSLDPADYPLDNTAALTALGQRVVADVAAHFSPDSNRAELDVPLRNLLFIVEQVCRDMRELLDAKVPFSHLITIQNGVQLWRWKEKLGRLNYLRRTLAMVVAPFSALPAELSQYFAGKLTDYPKGLLERWLLQTLIKKIGFYAIGLYSGHLLPPAMGQITEPKADTHAKLPLRILVAGQTKAGKSSLINALLGEFRAPADVLPVSDRMRIYPFRQGELDELLLYDSPGYSENRFWFQNSEAQLGDFDLILLVCSAVQAGRAADSGFLSALQTWFSAHSERRMPPVLAVISHIDNLRPFREWGPPYDIQSPTNAKAQNICDAVASVSESLEIPLADCVPVCLAPPSARYNIESVSAAMAAKLPESLRTQYLRTLAESRSYEKIRLLLTQLGIRREGA